MPQFERFERPFWLQTLPQLTAGRVSAEIVPFDQAGIRAQEMLRLMQLGVVPFGNALLTPASAQDALLAAPDLAGLATDPKELARLLAASRPVLARVLQQRYGLRLLALFAYPAQVVFCRQPFNSISDLAGRRVRTSGVPQSDLVEALGGRPVQIPFADLASSFRQQLVDCAITGASSGRLIGLHEVTTHVSAQPISWGLSVFAVNQTAWDSLDKPLQRLLERELATLERRILADIEAQTHDGLACLGGAASCRDGIAGRRLTVVRHGDDARHVREAFATTVLPRWLKRCGAECTTLWSQTLAPATDAAVAAR